MIRKLSPFMNEKTSLNNRTRRMNPIIVQLVQYHLSFTICLRWVTSFTISSCVTTFIFSIWNSL